MGNNLEESLEIPKVSIPDEGEFRFVLVKGSTGKNYLYGTKYFLSHQSVLEYGFLNNMARRGLDASHFTCVGGGSMIVDNDRKLIYASGESMEYGKFERYVVRSLLEKYADEKMKGYSVKVE